jgi:hypothetical protein
MPTTKLYIKNRVCPRCISTVEQLVRNKGTEPVNVQLGEVVLQDPLSAKQLEQIADELKQLGFELLDDVRKQQIDKIKTVVIEQVHYTMDEKFAFVEVISKALHKEYSQLSKLFSETEGITTQ